MKMRTRSHSHWKKKRLRLMGLSTLIDRSDIASSPYIARLRSASR